MIDVLTPGELTGGKAVAATGELADLSGDVGEIGGVAQKTVTVQRAGAEVFLVPAPTTPRPRPTRTRASR